ncbi:hypothetical protein SEA_MADAMATO_63 [Streptomyces phage Madamato]|nr:hypothetical protein SEA_MADAMATO_63 [Streptomyces phage Madamato]
MSKTYSDWLKSPTWTCHEDADFSKAHGEPWCIEHDKPLSTVIVSGDGRICNTGVEALPHEFLAAVKRRFKVLRESTP